MLLQGILLVTVILLYPDLIQKSTSQQFGSQTCTSDNIEKFNSGGLSKCDCQGPAPQCTQQCNTAHPCGGKSGVYLLNQNTCDKGCGSDDNRNCKSCYIWFSALCQCLKDGPNRCPVSNHQNPPVPPYWVQLNAGLATTTQRIPDILDLQLHTSLRETGWNFGQEQWKKSGQALAVNSVHSKTEDQVHMHICPSNDFMRLFLSRLSSDTDCVSKYKSLQPVIVGGAGSVQVEGPGSQLCVNPKTGSTLTPYTMYCRTPGQTSIDGASIARDIDNVLNDPQKTQCADYVGAAVVVDNHDYTWLCVTNDHLDTEHRFCYNP